MSNAADPLSEENLRLRREVTRLQATAQLVREREQTLHFLFEAVSDLIVTLHQDGRILSVNSSLQRIFGFHPEAVIGQPVTLLMPDHLQRASEAAMKRFIRTGMRTIPGRLRTHGKHQDGHEFPIEVSFDGFRQPDGTWRFTGMIRDLTQQVADEERERRHLSELTHRQRLRSVGEMATGLAHELNQPLLAICLQADMAVQMLDALPGDIAGSLRTSLREIADESQRASRIVKAVRTLVRRESPVRQKVRIADLIETILPICERWAERSSIRIECQVAPDLPEVRVEPVQIEQVIANLVQNAVDAMSGTPQPQRRIELLATPATGSRIQLSIRDYGEGLPEGPAERLFDSFFTTRPHGIGLGLAICRSIVEDHGGQIRAERPSGGGARFVMTLPVEPPDSAPDST